MPFDEHNERIAVVETELKQTHVQVSRARLHPMRNKAGSLAM